MKRGKLRMADGGLELTKRPTGDAADVELLKRKSWPGFSAQYIRISGAATYDFRIDADLNYLTWFNLYRTDGETSSPGFPPSRTKDLRNKLIYSPSGCEIEGWCRMDKSGTITSIAIEQHGLSKSAVDLPRIPANIEFEDEMLRSLLVRFQAILDNSSLDTPGYAAALIELLTFELDRATSHQPIATGIAGNMSAAQVRIITDYMEIHLAEKTAIADLAALVDLTRFHFIRSFKQATGITPHQFLIRRRVERAKELLSQRNLDISEVAARTGFSSATQLTRSFRQISGMTPSAYARSG